MLEGRVPPERIAQKLVLIGTSAVGLLDIKTTPVDPVMPGVEIHAQVLESVLTRTVLSQPNWAIAAEFFSALILGLLVIAFAPMFGPVTLVAVGALFATVLIGTSWYFYTQHRLLIDFTYPLAVDHVDLPDPDLLELRPGAEAAPADPLGLRPVSVAGADRAAGAVAGKTPARRRRARDDDHVLRRPRLHHHLGILQARSAGADRR